jgi:L-gulonolactone oxidase
MLLLLFLSLITKLQVDVEKCFVVAEAGITLVDLQEQIARSGLAMHNLGSISTQALGGVISTATHGTGIKFKVLPGDVMALTILLASGELVACSREERSELFFATLSGLGCTGLIVTAQLSVEPAFRLREVQETVPFDDVVDDLDVMVTKSEHVRLWWYPQSRAVRVSSADRTTQVRPVRLLPTDSRQDSCHKFEDDLTPSQVADAAPSSCPSFWRALLTMHLVEFLLFISRWIPQLTYYVGRYALWMDSARQVTIDDSASILNLNCRVRVLPLHPPTFCFA